MRVANQDSQNIVSFKIAGADGRLDDSGAVVTELPGVCPAVVTRPTELGTATTLRLGTKRKQPASL